MRGSTLLDRIQDEIRDQNSELSTAERELQGFQVELAELHEEKAELYDGLARVYLPELSSEAARSTLRQAFEGVQDVLRQKTRRQSNLRSQNQALEESRESLWSELREVEVEIDGHEELVDKRVAAYEEALSERPAYVRAVEQHERLQDEITFLEGKAETAEREVTGALPTYNDPIFRYLKRRGLDTDQPKGWGLTRIIDRWLSRQHEPEFREQADTKDFAKEIPAYIDRAIQRKRSRARELAKQAQEMEKEAAQEVGLVEATNARDTLYERRDMYVNRIEGIDSTISANDTELERMRESSSQFYERANDIVEGILKSEGMEQLRYRAQQTPSPEDDRLVDAIERVEEQIATTLEVISDAETRVGGLERGLQDLRKVETKVESEFSYSRSRIKSGFDIDDALVGFYAGRLSATDIIRDIDDNHFLKPRPSYTSSSSSSSSEFGGFGGSSGWGGGGGGLGGGGWSGGGRLGGSGGGWSGGGGL